MSITRPRDRLKEVRIRPSTAPTVSKPMAAQRSKTDLGQIASGTHVSKRIPVLGQRAATTASPRPSDNGTLRRVSMPSTYTSPKDRDAPKHRVVGNSQQKTSIYPVTPAAGQWKSTSEKRRQSWQSCSITQYIGSRKRDGDTIDEGIDCGSDDAIHGERSSGTSRLSNPESPLSTHSRDHHKGASLSRRNSRKTLFERQLSEGEYTKKKNRRQNRRSRHYIDPNENDERVESSAERRDRLHRLFWRTLQLVRAISSIFYRLKRSTMDSTETSQDSDLYYYAANQSISDKSLSFDKRKFSRKCMLRLPTWAQLAASKLPGDRTEEDLRRLHTIMKTMKSFQEKFTENMQRHICHVASYTYCEKGRVVLRQGHPAQNFYFIYSGSVFVQFETIDNSTGRNITRTEAVIGQGQSFGELAFLSDGLRTASIICRETTELFQIDKPAFMELCPDIFSKELTEKIRIAKDHSIFDCWPEERLTKLCFESQLQNIPHGKLIEKDWSKAQHLYFVAKGGVALIKQFSILTALDQMKSKTYAKYADRLLPTDKSHYQNECFSKVEELKAGDHSDFGVLREENDAEPVIMISKGATLLRISRKLLEQLAPPFSIEHFMRKCYIPKSIPSKDELLQKYISELIWTEYRSQIVNIVRSERKGALLASIPATKKGSSGWAKWPGKVNVQNQEAVAGLNKMFHLDEYKIKSRLFPRKESSILPGDSKSSLRAHLPINHYCQERTPDADPDVLLTENLPKGVAVLRFSDKTMCPGLEKKLTVIDKG